MQEIVTDSCLQGALSSTEVQVCSAVLRNLGWPRLCLSQHWPPRVGEGLLISFGVFLTLRFVSEVFTPG